MVDLKGRRALVTGGAVRVGRALALALAEAGADVAIHYCNSEDAALSVAKDIEAMGRKAALVRGDLALAADVGRLVGDASAGLGGCDLLINNASIFERGSLADLQVEEWDRMLRVNARAPLLLGRDLAAGLPDDGRGDVIHLNDIYALTPRADYFAYTQSKALLHALTANMAKALAPQVRVNAVALGAVLPPDAPPDGYEHTKRDELPLGRFPKVEDVVRAALFLLSCPSVTGETIRVDGGQHLSLAPESHS